MRLSPTTGQPIRLGHLLPDTTIFGTRDVPVGSCCTEPRAVRPGDLFVVLPGRGDCGRKAALEAEALGATAILAAEPMPSIGLPVCVTDDVHGAYAKACQALAGHPSEKVRVIGVTGAAGKTTTSCLLASILSTAGYRVGLWGTLGGFDGLDFQDSSVTTPPPEELATWLTRTAANDCTHGVLEVSDAALDRSGIAGIEFDAVCLTNLRREDGLVLLDQMGDGGFAVINADDPISKSHLARIGTPVLTIAIHTAAEISAQIHEQFISEQTFLLTAGDETVPVRTRMIGEPHVYNCLAAAAVGLGYGIDLVTVVRGLEDVDHVPGRLERLECGQPFGVFVDTARTGAALSGTLRTLRRVVEGRLICVFGGSADQAASHRRRIGRAIEKEADLAVLTAGNPGTEDPRTIESNVLEGFLHPETVRLVPDRCEAIGQALAEARSGDCVLIAGRGHEKYQDVGGERVEFDDRHVARALLYQMEPTEA